ncbi:MAG: hypothetical protein ACUVQ0_04885 [Thermoproteota archaeon]
MAYYGASYIKAAVESDLTLVADYLQIYDVSKKYVRTLRNNEY